MALTKHEALIRGLEVSGYTEVSTASRMYRCFARAGSEANVFMWVGKNGALRRGRNVTTAMSWSNTDRARELERLGREAA